MEENLNNFFEILQKNMLFSLDIKKINPDSYSSLSLAFIGDAVYDIIARYFVMSSGDASVSHFHKKKAEIVNAENQAYAIEALLDRLTDKELSIYKRGRNAKSNTSSKNACIGDYRKATGFEALIGYLYLSGEIDRLLELTCFSIKNN